MAARATLNEKRARELFDQGRGCNAIARDLGVDPATVSRWAKREGLIFDRSQVESANAARTIDLAKARIELAQEMAATGLELLRSRGEPYLVYAFGGKDNTFNKEMLDRAPVEVIRNMVTTAGIAFDKASRVVEASPEGIGEAESVLDRIEGDVGREFVGVDDSEFTGSP